MTKTRSQKIYPVLPSQSQNSPRRRTLNVAEPTQQTSLAENEERNEDNQNEENNEDYDKNLDDRTPLYPQLSESDEELIAERCSATGSKTSYWRWLPWILAIFAIVLAVAKGSPFIMSPVHVVRPHVWLDVEKRIRSDIKPKYENVVPFAGFRVMEIALKEILNRNESLNEKYRVPSVLLLIASKSNENIVRCFASDLMKLIANACKNTNGDIIESSAVTKSEIIDRFNSNFENDKSRSIFLNEIDKLKGNNPTLLHPYTDHDNSKFKDVVILLSAYSKSGINIGKSATSKEMDKIANDLLQRAWIGSMDDDNIGAMLSRLTPSVIAFMNDNERKFTC